MYEHDQCAQALALPEGTDLSWMKVNELNFLTQKVAIL